MDCGTKKNCNDYSGFVSLNVRMNATKLIFQIGIQDLIKNCKKSFLMFKK